MNKVITPSVKKPEKDEEKEAQKQTAKPIIYFHGRAPCWEFDEEIRARKVNEQQAKDLEAAKKRWERQAAQRRKEEAASKFFLGNSKVRRLFRFDLGKKTKAKETKIC